MDDTSLPVYTDGPPGRTCQAVYTTTMHNRNLTITIDHVSGPNDASGQFDFSVQPDGFRRIVAKSVSFADGCKFVATMLAIPARPARSSQFGPPDKI